MLPLAASMRTASAPSPLLSPNMLTRAPPSMESYLPPRAGTRWLGFGLRRHDDGRRGCSNNSGG